MRWEVVVIVMEDLVEMGVLKVVEIKKEIGLTRMGISLEIVRAVTIATVKEKISTERQARLPKEATVDVIDAHAEEVKPAQMEATTVNMMVKTSMARSTN